MENSKISRIWFNTENIDDYSPTYVISSIWPEPNEEAEYFMDLPYVVGDGVSCRREYDVELPNGWHPWNVDVKEEDCYEKDGKYYSEEEYLKRFGSIGDSELYIKHKVYSKGKLVKIYYV